MNVTDEIKQLRKRVAQLEAAHTLSAMRQTSDDEGILTEACSQIRVGVALIQSSSKSPEAVRARSFLAYNLHTRMGWSVDRIASAMHKTRWGVKKMIPSTP